MTDAAKNARALRLAAIAAAGPLAVAARAHAPVSSDLVDAAFFFFPFLGAAAFLWFLVHRFARGYFSAAGLILVGIPAYFAAILAAIVAAGLFY